MENIKLENEQAEDFEDIATKIARRIALLHVGGKAYANKGGKAAPANERVLCDPTGTGVPLLPQELEDLRCEARAALVEGMMSHELEFSALWKFAANSARRAFYQSTKEKKYGDLEAARKGGARAHRVFLTQLEEEAEEKGIPLEERAFEFDDSASGAEDALPLNDNNLARALHSLAVSYVGRADKKAKSSLEKDRAFLQELFLQVQSGVFERFNRLEKTSETRRKKMAALAKKITPEKDSPARGKSLARKPSVLEQTLALLETPRTKKPRTKKIK